MSLSWKEKLRKFAARFTDDPESRMGLYSGMGILYTPLAVLWFLVDVKWGIAWSVLAAAAWGLAYLNWRKFRSVKR
ncbi:MAG: hypothetical protein OXG15_02770 [Gammaproteobacteria bacterium]|nr:hypothetical protein [Gammaproteobacteria bacterium]